MPEITNEGVVIFCEVALGLSTAVPNVVLPNMELESCCEVAPGLSDAVPNGVPPNMNLKGCCESCCTGIIRRCLFQTVCYRIWNWGALL